MIRYYKKLNRCFRKSKIKILWDLDEGMARHTFSQLASWLFLSNRMEKTIIWFGNALTAQHCIGKANKSLSSRIFLGYRIENGQGLISSDTNVPFHMDRIGFTNNAGNPSKRKPFHFSQPHPSRFKAILTYHGSLCRRYSRGGRCPQQTFQCREYICYRKSDESFCL